MAQILIVDDSPTEIHVARSVLEKLGHIIEIAENGEDGISRAKEFKPDLILMDVVMPGMNGFQATRKISKDPELAEIPIIIVTSKDQETDRVWGLRQGAKAYITKPVAEDELVEKVNSVLGA
ncbi:response regulator [Thiohalomonas denitrificans]|uniref:Twitching motility two-component system response regulator PilH n=1 Tax=Thiohalomonas denitrificans TaxID=415747 RepID=A0A1G5QJR2_9GAMM|nr:response regulator [Thiohalomonas denitrificans]SCZ61848.1 twitching motility two-component system response regulator PilH [Thiohalomonas denitrificans]